MRTQSGVMFNSSMSFSPRSSGPWARWHVAAPVALAVVHAASAQQFVQETSTRFPTQTDYTNQCTAVDIDGDGDLDIVWANGQGYSSQGAALPVRIYVNNGSGVFADETSTRATGITGWYRGVEAGDIDRDGDWDLVLANDFNKRPQLLVNDGTGRFTDQTGSRLPAFTMSSARAQFGDVDGDGDLDLAFCNNGTTRFGSGQPRLYLNDGTGVFADATSLLPAGNVSQQMDILFLDVDNDLDLDLFLATRATAPNQSRLWKNDGTGRFSLQPGIPNDSAAYSYDAGDMDGDGDLDLIGINAGASNGELLLRNNGDGTSWTNVSAQISPNPAVDDNDSRFVDLDMDGDLDLVIGSLGSRDRIYLNNGSGSFTETTALMAAVSDSTIDIKVADFDNDGRFDIVTAQGESGSFQNRIFMNVTGPVDTRAPRVVTLEQVSVGREPVDHVVRANIWDDMTSDRGFHDRGVTLRWSVDGEAEQSTPMAWNGNNQWRGVIPAGPASAQVRYWVTARDWSNNVGTSAEKFFTEPGPPPPPPVTGDLNGDRVVNGADLGIMLAEWEGGASSPADLNGDGRVDGLDLGVLLANWTA
ncbi:MAG: hypothetical protein RI990_447 [Planctomycetota bacterium]